MPKSVSCVTWLFCVIALSISISNSLPARESKFSLTAVRDCGETSALAPDAKLKVVP